MIANRNQPEDKDQKGRVFSIRNNHALAADKLISFIMNCEDGEKLAHAVYDPPQRYLKEKTNLFSFSAWFIYCFSRVRDKDAREIIHEVSSRDPATKRARLFMLQQLVDKFPTGGWTSTSINSNILWNLFELIPYYHETDPDPRTTLKQQEDLIDIAVNLFIPKAKEVLKRHAAFLNPDQSAFETPKKQEEFDKAKADWEERFKEIKQKEQEEDARMKALINQGKAEGAPAADGASQPRKYVPVKKGTFQNKRNAHMLNLLSGIGPYGNPKAEKPADGNKPGKLNAGIKDMLSRALSGAASSLIDNDGAQSNPPSPRLPAADPVAAVVVRDPLTDVTIINHDKNVAVVDDYQEQSLAEASAVVTFAADIPAPPPINSFLLFKAANKGQRTEADMASEAKNTM